MDDFAAVVARHGLSPECQADLLELMTQDGTGAAWTGLRTSGLQISLPSIEQTFPLEGSDEEVEALTASTSSTATQRYEDLGILGVGALAEVRRVLDRDLNRTIAMQVLHSQRQASPAKLAEFVAEAQLTARLQHPGIVPIYDLGRRPDGRLYFTMREVRGESLRDWMVRWVGMRDRDRDWRLAMSLYERICDAVGYAHAEGVLHRDLKPANIMIGEHGMVCVVDWGLGTLLGPTQRAAGGTPAFMPPEQARGELATTASDTFALGGVLMEMLTGQTPWTGSERRDVLIQIRAGASAPWPGLLSGAPQAMVDLARRALSVEVALRPQRADRLAETVRSWLGGTARRARAQEMVDEAAVLRDKIEASRLAATELRDRATAVLAGLQPTADVGQKSASWAEEDKATHMDRQAVVARAEHLQTLRAALSLAPDFGPAHRALADWFRQRHERAESAGNEALALRDEVFLRHHDRDGAHATYLAGTGQLCLSVDAPDGVARLFRYERVDRRLVPVPFRNLGRLPISDMPVPMGSYVAMVRAPGRPDMRVPIFIDRGRRWTGIHPDGGTNPLVMPRQVPKNCCVVPEGWFWSGGDPDVPCLARRRLWVAGFVMQTYPVSNREYLRFLDDLVATGREAEALLHVPRERAGTTGELGPMIYGRSDAGTFELRPDADGDEWDPEAPVLMVDWQAARAYASWLAARDHLPWRLPVEFEWEKAARGVDGRSYPWGDHADPNWLCIRASHTGPAMPPVRDQYPLDESPYGVRGMAGGVRDWCLDEGSEAGPPLSGDVVDTVVDGTGSGPRVYRGGDWYGLAVHARLAYRAWNKPQTKNASLGFRLCYSL